MVSSCRCRSALFAAVLLFTSLARAGGMGAAAPADFARVPLPRDVPEVRAVLKVSSDAGFTSSTVFDLDGLMAFPSTEFTETDPWDGVTYRYAGVLLLPLLERLGMDARATYVEVRAANEYTARIRVEDLRRIRYLLAYRLDGTLLRDHPDRKRRGSLMIAIDFRSNPGLDPELVKSQLVWQVSALALE